MSLKILVEDQIDKLFQDNPELNSVDKNKFEIAVASFANLKHLHGIEFDDLIDGIMGDGGDEGIDHCYLFCNGMLIADENHPINKESHIKAKFFQAKQESSFSTDGFRKMKEGIEEIFNLEIDLSKLHQIGANSDILEKAELIRNIFRKAGRVRAKFSCEIFYVTISPDMKISTKIIHLADELKTNELRIPFEISFWGAQDILNLTESHEETVEVKFISQPLEIKERDVNTNGFSGFVNGNDAVECLLDKNGEFKSHLTEGNVRFFLGEDVNINSSIIDSAKDNRKAEIFWAMNNGLTIIGDSITPLGNNQYAILNPQIVNGCQTIHCLYHVYKEKNKLHDSIKVFVKLVNTNNLDVQTDIISATNSQNPVKAASLKANDNIQRNIEKHLKKSGIFYERRENYYKRQGYTGNKVIGLLKMAQIIHSVVNKESIVALNDTASLFETEAKYNSIFSDAADFDIYTFSTILYQKIWTLKNSDLRNNAHQDDIRGLISRGGFVFLHCMSSLILSDSEFKTDKNTTKRACTKNIVISTPARKNEFVKRKTSALKLLSDDNYLKDQYEIAKDIFFRAAEKFSTKSAKSKISLFKNRNFDRDYLRGEIDTYISAK